MPKPALDGLLMGFRTALSLLPAEAQLIFAGKLERLAADIRREVREDDDDGGPGQTEAEGIVHLWLR